MKRTILFTIIIVLYLSTGINAQPDENIIWSKFQYPIYELFTGPDTNFIYGNQWTRNRFVKIDANTGDIIDSVYLGSIFGFSKDYKYIYVRGNYIGTIKKLDISTYEIVDSIDNYQDIYGRIKDVKLTNDGRLIVSLIDDNYAFAILNEEDFEITFKQLKAELGEYFNYPTQIATSPKNDYFILDQYYKKFNQQTNQWEPWDEVHVWDLKKLKPIGKILFKGAIDIFDIFTFSPDGEYVFIRDSVLNIYETSNFNLIKRIDAITGIDFTFDGKYFVINYIKHKPYETYIGFYDYKSFEQICDQKSDTERSPLFVKLSIDNKYIFTSDVANAKFTKYKTCLQNTNIIEDKENNYEILVNSNKIIISGIAFQNPDEINYTIIDIKGNIIQQGKANYEGQLIRIDISNLINGVYFIRFADYVHKFSVVR